MGLGKGLALSAIVVAGVTERGVEAPARARCRSALIFWYPVRGFAKGWMSDPPASLPDILRPRTRHVLENVECCDNAA
jgi:hypothetical protein